MFPPQSIAAGSAFDNKPPALFRPFSIRGCTFQNKVWVSPMCQYSCGYDGRLTDFHFSHATAFCLRGPSLTIIEATAVTPEGRITPHDSGLWDENQIDPIARITKFAHDRKQLIGIQLAHAGRKASTLAPWQMKRGLRVQVASATQGGWADRVIGPADEPWDEHHARPTSMSLQQIDNVVNAFAQSARYAVRAKVDVIEVHAAHGYLLSSFLSATVNTRTDQYGGDLTNRMRLLLRIVEAVRKVVPSTMPLLVRISGSEWLPSSQHTAWDLASSVALAQALDEAGVDVLTISSGGVASGQKVPRTAEYQTDLARAIRTELHRAGCDILIGGVGRIAEPRKADELLSSAQPSCDVVLIGRQFLKEPSWVLRAAHELNVRIQWPVQYQLGRHGLENKL